MKRNMLKMMPKILEIERNQPYHFAPMFVHLLARLGEWRERAKSFPGLESITIESFPLSSFEAWLKAARVFGSYKHGCTSCREFLRVMEEEAASYEHAEDNAKVE